MPADVVEQALDLLCANYVFPGKAAEAAEAIRARLAGGDYAGLTGESLADRLTGELFGLCADRHLRVRVRSADTREATTEEDLTAAWHERQRLGGYGVTRAERLPGNVGYIALHGITPPAVGGRAIAAAMELVSQTHALIFDLRRNRGGDPDGVVFWNSYLFPDSETHLNSIFDAATGETRQYWTLPYVPGERYLGRPVFVLISDFTFSAGEEFAYNLKAQRRAVVIGTASRGGAHPTDVFPITSDLEITIPVARSINPVTGTNWEGTGVEPDVPAGAEDALGLAYQRALRHVLTTPTSHEVLAEARENLN